eukprot:gene8269-9151_t
MMNGTLVNWTSIVGSLLNYSRTDNSTNSTPPMQKPKSIGMDVVVYMMYTVIFLTGMVGNMLVVLKITRSDKNKSLKHCFLLNLAITDLLTLFLLLPLSIMAKNVSWPLGEFVCRYVFPLTDVVIGVSVLTHVSISLDRYRTIIYPMAAKPSHLQRILILISIWIIAYLLNGLPLSLVLSVGKGFWVAKACIPTWPSHHLKQAYYLQRFIVIFIIPIIVNFLAYVKISKALKVSLLLLQGSARGQKRETRIHSQQRLIRMFRTIFVAFVVCFFPIHLFTIIDEYCMSFGKWQGSGHIFQFALVFAYANSMCNPVILVMMSAEYKNAFTSYLSILKCHNYWLASHGIKYRASKCEDVIHSPVNTHVELLPMTKIPSPSQYCKQAENGNSSEAEEIGLTKISQQSKTKFSDID